MASVQEGDEIQWTANGVDQFVEPRKVTWVSDCGGYCGVQGSNTGVPTNQVTVLQRAAGRRAAAVAVEEVIHPEVELHVETIYIQVKEPNERLDIPSEDEKFTLFWHGPFSQWHKCRFVVDGVVYNCAEQYMMAGKARTFQDFNALEKIMKSTDPSVQKKAGRAVRGFDEMKWNVVARDLVYKGNHAKFTQNPSLLKALLATKGTTLVEASPYDKIWGIGRHADDPLALRRETWNGKNWLGETLTRLRDDLAKK